MLHHVTIYLFLILVNVSSAHLTYRQRISGSWTILDRENVDTYGGMLGRAIDKLELQYTKYRIDRLASRIASIQFALLFYRNDLEAVERLTLQRDGAMNLLDQYVAHKLALEKIIGEDNALFSAYKVAKSIRRRYQLIKSEYSATKSGEGSIKKSVTFIDQDETLE